MTKPEFMIFWGCWGQPGHYLHNAYTGHTLRDSECKRFLIPRASQLDGSWLFLPKEGPQHGAITYLPAPDRTILAWWNRVFDKRGQVNSAIIVPGRLNHFQVWEAFYEHAFAIAKHHTMPLIAKGDIP